MPQLAAMFMGFFGSLFGSAADTLTRKAALIAGAVALIATCVAGAVAAVTTLCAGLLYAFPGPVGLGVWLFVPDNASACAGICVACDAGLAAASWWRSNVRLGAVVAG